MGFESSPMPGYNLACDSAENYVPVYILICTSNGHIIERTRGHEHYGHTSVFKSLYVHALHSPWQVTFRMAP